MMRKIFLLLLLTFSISLFSKDVEKVSAYYEYISSNPNETPEQVVKIAFERAKLKALEEKFGLDVGSVSNSFLKNKSSGDKNESVTDVMAISSASVRGEWIETTEEKIISQPIFDKGFWRVKVFVSGKARGYVKPKTDIKYQFINNLYDRENRLLFYDGDDLFLKFSSPVSGSLCVYLVDEAQDVYCLLPYMSVAIGAQQIDANKDYIFFYEKYDGSADEYTLNCQKSVEQNALYIVFSPNSFTKANDNKSGKNWRDEELPRSLKYKDFIKWLAKVQLVDEDMVVIVDMITIKK